VVVSFGLGQYWQYEIRNLMGVTDHNVALVAAWPFVAALSLCLILLIGRGLRGLYRWAAQLLNRWIGSFSLMLKKSLERPFLCAIRHD
jgi:hypothetical protein